MKFLLASILNDGQCSAHFTWSLLQSTVELQVTRIDLFPLLLEGKGADVMLVNQAITTAYKNDFEGLFLVGSQCGWETSTLTKLIESGKSAIAAPVWANNRYDLMLGELSRLQRDESNGCIKVKEASLDFCYLSKEAIRDLCDAHPEINWNGESIKLVIQNGDIYDSHHSNEAILAYRLRELGHELWLHPYAKTLRTSKQASWSSFGEALDEELAKQS